MIGIANFLRLIKGGTCSRMYRRIELIEIDIAGKINVVIQLRKLAVLFLYLNVVHTYI